MAKKKPLKKQGLLTAEEKKERAAEQARRRKIRREKKQQPITLPPDKVKVPVVKPFKPTAIYSRVYETEKGEMVRYYAKGTIPSGEEVTRTMRKEMAASVAAELGKEKQAMRIYDAIEKQKAKPKAKKPAPPTTGKKIVKQKGKIGVASLEKAPKKKKQSRKKNGAEARPDPDLGGFGMFEAVG